MNTEQVRTLIPLLDIRPPDEFGFAHAAFFFDRMLDAGRSRLKFNSKDISNISLQFLDGKLIYIGIVYADSIKWDSLEEYIARLNSSLNLPAVWESGSFDKTLRCDGFQVNAFLAGGTGTLSLHDTTAEQLLATRKMEKKDNQKQTFRP